jgi:hypothetical protein
MTPYPHLFLSFTMFRLDKLKALVNGVIQKARDIAFPYRRRKEPIFGHPRPSVRRRLARPLLHQTIDNTSTLDKGDVNVTLRRLQYSSLKSIQSYEAYHRALEAAEQMKKASNHYDK